MVAALPGLTALVALLFTWMSVGQTRTELRIAEQGQITNRFNTAIGNIGSKSVDTRLGGIYALQRIMQDSARDQPAIVSVLCAYLRQNAHIPASGFDKLSLDDLFYSRKAHASSDVQAALTVLSERSPRHDGASYLDLSGTELRHAQVPEAPFRFALLADADLRGAFFHESDLRDADFSRSNLTMAWLPGATLTRALFQDANLELVKLFGAKLSSANFSNANLRQAELGLPGEPATDLTKASFFGADLREASLEGAKLVDAILVDADMSGAVLIQANLQGARLSAADERLTYELGTDDVGTHASLRKADLTEADLRGADLRGVDLSGADLTRADLRGAKLSGAKLTGATLTDTRGCRDNCAYTS
ncbi:pentapeptide repeat-containing protein [Streptomyces sp. NPDC093094]|uniref:pentapeptide repeat-containing protein n=1 Tax=Streptomyces sp. NPDC093094 TaxID=3366026 RepID=UPI0037FA1F7D